MNKQINPKHLKFIKTVIENDGDCYWNIKSKDIDENSNTYTSIREHKTYCPTCNKKELYIAYTCVYDHCQGSVDLDSTFALTCKDCDFSYYDSGTSRDTWTSSVWLVESYYKYITDQHKTNVESRKH